MTGFTRTAPRATYSGLITTLMLAGCFAACTPVVGGAVITYAPPPLVGTNVTYSPVSESSNGTLPLYGTPTISGNVLSFRNLNFVASSVDAAPAIDFVDGQLNATLTTAPGDTLSTLSLSEFGDYNVSATPANPAAINYVKVYSDAVQITVLAENGVPLAAPLVDNTSVVLTVSPSGGDFQTGVDPSVGSWTGTASANLSSLFDSSNITEVSISFDNELLAESQAFGIATISKKGFDLIPGVVGTTPTPEPAMMMLPLALWAAGSFRRRYQVRSTTPSLLGA